MQEKIVRKHKTKYLFFRKIKQSFFTFIMRREADSVGRGVQVNCLTRVTRNTTIKEYSCFNGMRIKGKGNVIIGRYFHSGQDCLIITDVHNYEGEKIPYDNTDIIKNVVVDDFVWLGDRVIILGGVHIGEGAILQAGAVVVSDIPKYGIAGGNPAKVFKYRDGEHFEKKKKEGKFH